MGTGSLLPTELLWRYALAAIPLVLIVAGITRWAPCRPATRHMLWLAVLLWLVAAPLLPQAPALSIIPTSDTAASSQATALPSTANAVNADDEGLSYNREFVPPGLQRPVARSPEMTSPPGRLAQADGSGGPLSPLCQLPPSLVAGGEWTERPSHARGDTGPFDSAIKEHVGSDATDPVDPSASSSPEAFLRVPSESTETNSPVEDEPFLAMTAPRIESTELWNPSRRSRSDHSSIGVRVPSIKPTVPTSESDYAPGTRSVAAPVVAWVAGLIAVRDAIGELPPIPNELWFGGTALLIVLAGLRVVRFRRRVMAALPAPDDVRRLVRRAARAYGLRNVPETRMVQGRVSPMIWCGRPVKLLLPVTLWSELDEAGRKAVVYHELAHVRRRDHWVSWIEMAIGMLYWWHPLVWWARSRMRSEAEICCDAWVTSLLPRGRRAYAEALLRTKDYIAKDLRRMPAMGIGMTSGRAGRFARRLTMVMTHSTKPKLSVSGLALVLIVAGAGWMATPARSCPPDEKRVEVKAKHKHKHKHERKARRKVERRRRAESGAIAGIGSIEGCKKVRGRDCCGCCAKEVGNSSCCKGQDCCAKHRAGVGIGCDRCQSGKPCQGCGLGAAGVLDRPARTFDNYLAQRKAGFGPVVARALGSAIGSAVLAGHDDDDDDDDNLEERLERLERKLEKLTQRLMERAHAPGPHWRAPRDPNAERAPRAPRPPREPRAPRAGREPRMPRPPAPDVESLFDPDARRGETVIRKYELPDGKREALTELMARSDVPVLIRALPDGIEVHGTPRQHKIFRAFVRMIDPPGDGRSMVEPESFELPGEPTYDHAQRAYREALVAGEAKRAEVQAMMEAAARLQAELHDHKGHAQQLQMEREAMEAEIDHIRAEADRIREESDRVETRADELRARAEDIRAEAESVREESESIAEKASEQESKEAAEELKENAKALAQRAREMEMEARHMDREAERVMREAEAMRREAERVEQRIERVESRGERLEQRREEARQRAEELREQLEEAESAAKEAQRDL